MTLDQLRTFQTVAAAKSFRHAAELLHITQPAISKQVQALEAELDQKLFERGRSAQLTLAGTALLKHVAQLSRILMAAKEEIADLRELRTGHLSIGAAHSVATYVLPNLIEVYRARYPKVNLSIEAGWSADIARRVVSYDLDLGLLVLLSPKLEAFPQLTFVPLATTDLVFVVSPNHPLAKKKRLTWDELKEAPWILNQHGCIYRSYIETRLKERGQVMKVEVEVIGLELQKRLTQLGLGVSLLPKIFVTTEIQQGTLRTLHVTGTKLQAYSRLVFRNDKYIHRPMRAFIELLPEAYGPAQYALKG
jgi:LysR family transcriptional regulator, transcriptional activator of the cysJI operon